MGFCSGTDIFEPIAGHILNGDYTDQQKHDLIKVVVQGLYAHDWDCEGDSQYYNHQVVQAVMRELNKDFE